MPEVPASHADLLDRPTFAHLATVRPDGAPQSSVMWFAWDGQRARFSHTRARQKHRNLQHEPRVSFHVQDPDNPYRTLEVRGIVESIGPTLMLCSTNPSKGGTTSSPRYSMRTSGSSSPCDPPRLSRWTAASRPQNSEH
jgi:hypothetical protein